MTWGILGRSHERSGSGNEGGRRSPWCIRMWMMWMALSFFLPSLGALNPALFWMSRATPWGPWGMLRYQCAARRQEVFRQRQTSSRPPRGLQVWHVMEQCFSGPRPKYSTFTFGWKQELSHSWRLVCHHFRHKKCHACNIHSLPGPISLCFFPCQR